MIKARGPAQTISCKAWSQTEALQGECARLHSYLARVKGRHEVEGGASAVREEKESVTGEIEKGGKPANVFSSADFARTARENGPVDESTWTSRRWHRREPGSHPWRRESMVSRRDWSLGIVLE